MDLSMLPIKEQTQFLLNSFRNFYISKGYKIEKSVNITSKIDPSVYLVGSTISVLKHYLINKSIPSNGVCLIQRAIRTHQLKNLYNLQNNSEWCSYFVAMGTLATYEKLCNTIEDCIEFFIKQLEIQPSSILIRISSTDVDLVKACNNVIGYIQLEMDTMPINYYKHGYGLNGNNIRGRNLNIALKDMKTGIFKDIGNIIIIEDDEGKIGVEIALGASAILSRINGHPYVIQSSLIANSININTVSDCKIADCISVVSNLYFEGIYPNSSRMQGRLQKKYLMGLQYYSNKLNYSQSDIISILDDYIYNEYGTKVSCTEFLYKYLFNYICRKKDLSLQKH